MTVQFIFFTGCKKDKSKDNNQVIHVTEDILEAQTWKSGNIYVIDKPSLNVKAALDIQPGVIIKFTSEGLGMTLSGDGVLTAHGTQDQHIVFTSIKDDIHGGDTNEDGTNSIPAKYNWGTLVTNSQSASEFYYCDFFYGGINHSPSLSIRSYTGGKVISCTFAYNSGYDPKLGALDCSEANALTEVKNCIFYSNIIPLSINTSMSLDNSNVFHNPDLPATTNIFNVIIVKSISISENISWEETEVAFFIDDVNLWITGTLTLGDYVVLKLSQLSQINLKHGENDIINHDGPGVYFTSINDDTLKGDSNGDNSSIHPHVGDWSGIYDSTTGRFVTWPNILYSTP